MLLKVKALFALSIALLFAGLAMSAQAEAPPSNAGISPAQCGPGDAKEPGIQGEVPKGQTANYNCGVKLVGQLPLVGNVQGAGKCAYLRPRQPGLPQDGVVHIIDMSDPAKPVDVGTIPVQNGSETMRTVVTDKRAVLVSGSSVYDISDCLHPVLMGEIQWPPLHLAGITTRTLPHDLRVSRDGTKVFGAFGVWEADISNLKDSKTWTVTDHRCEVAAQIPGPWQELHRVTLKAGLSLCADSARPAPFGAGNLMGASPLQASLFWPQVSHSPDFNADDTLLYVGDQAGGTSGIWAPVAKVHIIDITKTPFKIVGEVDGAGHGLDWFRIGRREYILHSNERGAPQETHGDVGDPCHPYPRPYSLGWALEAYISDVTQPDKAHHVSMLQLAINDPKFCETWRASGGDASIAYHLIDNPMDAKFAMVNFGDAGLRFFDIRDPEKPTEVAYFNHGLPVHGGVGYYDAQRGLIYASGKTGFWVLQIEPQIRAQLGL